MYVLWQMLVTSDEIGSKPSSRTCSRGHVISVSDAFLAISRRDAQCKQRNDLKQILRRLFWRFQSKDYMDALHVFFAFDHYDALLGPQLKKRGVPAILINFLENISAKDLSKVPTAKYMPDFSRSFAVLLFVQIEPSSVVSIFGKVPSFLGPLAFLPTPHLSGEF